MKQLPRPSDTYGRPPVQPTHRTLMTEAAPNGGSVRFGEDVERLDIA
jgi:hypothetical protein